MLYYFKRPLEGKGLGLTLGGTMFIHSKRTSLSPMCAHAKMPTREGGGRSLTGVETGRNYFAGNWEV